MKEKKYKKEMTFLKKYLFLRDFNDWYINEVMIPLPKVAKLMNSYLKQYKSKTNKK